ncbi:MAG: hypothetical protein D6798_00120, partial [Deltaproteobacteria bacterium]
MGPVIVAVLLWLSAAARATGDLRAVVVAVDGGAWPGADVTVELSLADGEGRPYTERVPRLVPSEGVLLDAPRPRAPGRWRVRWRLPGQGREAAMQVQVGGQRIEAVLPLDPPPESGLVVPEVVEGDAGQREALTIPVGGTDLPPPDSLDVVVPVGVVEGVRATGDGLAVSWIPPADPLPRAVPMALRDSRQPHRPPAWVSLRLVGHPRVPVQTEPGAEVRATVGGRSYGPFVADADGQAMVEVRLLPGEHQLAIDAVDELGNARRSELELGGYLDPTLVLLTDGVIVPGAPLPDLHVGAFRADGRPWTGPPPRCRTGVQDILGLATIGPGRFIASLPPSASQMFDLKLECSLSDSVVGDLRVPVDATVPALVRLRVWPPELRADQPVAQVQAWLEGPTGDRLEVGGVRIEATHGTLIPEEAPPGMTVSTYDGRAAVDYGGDTITASWWPPAGVGLPWQLDVALAEVSDAGVLGLRIAARDRRGRPVAGSTVEVAVAGHRSTVTTDEAGTAAAEIPTGNPVGPWVVGVRSGSV